MMTRYKFRAIWLLVLLTALGGCATMPESAPVNVTVSGPVFSKADFKCGVEPMPPAAVDAKKQGSAAARYENGLRKWSRSCHSKLKAVEQPLSAAGQVK